MKLSFRNNFIGYFSFYHRLVGNGIFIYLGLSILISVMDGLGLAMFIPLLEFVSDEHKQVDGGKSLGQFQFIIKFIRGLGFDLNITAVLAVIAALFFLKGLLKFLQLTYYAGMRQRVINRIRYQLIDDLQGLSYSAFLRMDAGRIQNTFTLEVSRLFLAMTSYFNAAQYFFMLSTYIVLAFLANYQFALLVFLGSALFSTIYKRIYRRTKNASIELSKKGTEVVGFLIQAVHSFKYLKATNTFSKYADKLKNVLDHYEGLNRKMGNMKAIVLSIKEPITITIVSLVILLQINWMGTGLNTILLSLLLFYRALSFLVQVQNDWQAFIENIGGMHAVSRDALQMAAEQEVPAGRPFTGIHQQLLLQNVSLNYNKVKALDGINIEIPSKQTIALIGESGSGKTSIANVIAGLFVPSEGKVLVDDVPLTKFDLGSYRQKIGYISQESVVFNDSIYNNITFWAEPTKENRERFYKAVEMASLQEFIDALPEKEFTRVGDNGILISGGQKQRISIARELFKNCELLILDEATSALDSETEKVIQQNINQLHGTYTMVLIAHRLSTIKSADIIYLIDEGKILASGTFDEMISKSSRFRKMVSLQAV
ncbi:ABC transporter ATP-binding protein [Flavisolibacter nicotianae]|uniref:ABC transporter ATP-binding protein n=1 Tax=Flavisolibacter nicotianae TaxID=2364882 RepID=UPI000EABB444|nr:ABC transporter ATP-binding protein [Flavisolibacter nicotianae]